MIHTIDVALSQLGVHEATGKNDGIPAQRYMHGDELAWCAGFVLYCNANSDDENIARTTAEHYAMRSVSTMRSVFVRRGALLPRTSTPRRNMLVFFGNADSDVGVKGNHVGIVEAVDLEARTFTSIEGNAGNAVKRCIHPIDDVRITGWGSLDDVVRHDTESA